MGKYQSFATRGGQITLGLQAAMIAAVSAKEAELRKLTESNEVFATLDKNQVSITARGLGEYRKIGHFSMEQLPGCCGIVVSYHSAIETQFRGLGIGKLFLEIREDAARRAGYTVILATVVHGNEAEVGLLKQAGWSVSPPLFVNKRTKNAIALYTKELK